MHFLSLTTRRSVTNTCTHTHAHLALDMLHIQDDVSYLRNVERELFKREKVREAKPETKKKSYLRRE